jgi:hypothetical protein
MKCVVHNKFTFWGDFVVLANTQAEAEGIVEDACDVRQRLLDYPTKNLIQWDAMVSPADPAQKPSIAELYGTTVTTPSSIGFWWMKDTRANGWEVVRVGTAQGGEMVVYRTGQRYAEEIQTHCTEWVKLKQPV